MWPPGGGTGGPKHPKNNLRLNEVPTLRPNNLKNKSDMIFLRLDSNSVARNKVADQFSALYSLPLTKYKRLKLEKITNMHFRSSEALKSMIWSKLWEAIIQKNGTWSMNYEFAILQVFILAMVQHFYKVSWKSEGVTNGRLVDLTWNDPYSNKNFS